MAKLRIYDLREHVLALDLRDLLRLLAPRSYQAGWIVSTVKSSESGHEWFEATGEGGEQLEALAQKNAWLSGPDLAALAENTQQVIWGEFVGSAPTQSDKTWILIRAIDSTFYEIETDDEIALNKVASTYKDVRVGEAPVASWPQTRTAARATNAANNLSVSIISRGYAPKLLELVENALDVAPATAPQDCLRNQVD
jgi:hypothetical protein